MNGQPRELFSSTALVLLLTGALTLGGCASRAVFDEVAVNPESPAKGQIDAVLAKPGGYPTFSDIPAPPTDLPTAQSLRAEVQEQEAAGLQTLADTAPETWDLDASEAFAARAMADANVGGIRPPTDAEIAESEAFAAAARARAKPPPRPK